VGSSPAAATRRTSTVVVGDPVVRRFVFVAALVVGWVVGFVVGLVGVVFSVVACIGTSCARQRRRRAEDDVTPGRGDDEEGGP
jgi:hypothetical protein